MTHAPDSLHVAELGMAELQRICAHAHQLLRPVHTDVGIDAFIEVAEGTAPTGDLIGVQLKSGDSYLTSTGKCVVLPADADHFAYWARCAYPVIGVIHIPRLGKTYWVNLTRECSAQSILDGPHRAKVTANKSAEFTVDSLRAKVIPEMLSMTRQRLTLVDTNSLLRKRARLDASVDEDSADKLDSWQLLVELLVGISSTDDDVADAGYRLSRYYPAATQGHRDALNRALKDAPESSVAKMLRAIHLLGRRNDDHAAEALADLLKYVPGYAKRIRDLMEAHLLDPDAAGTAQQVLEYLGGDEDA